MKCLSLWAHPPLPSTWPRGAALGDWAVCCPASALAARGQRWSVSCPHRARWGGPVGAVGSPVTQALVAFRYRSWPDLWGAFSTLGAGSVFAAPHGRPGISVPWPRGSNPCPLHWKHGVSTTRPPGKSAVSTSDSLLCIETLFLDLLPFGLLLLAVYARISSLWGSPADSGCKEPARSGGDARSIPGPRRPPGEGDGSPPQSSCQESPTDGGAWQAAVHGGPRVGHDWATESAPAAPCVEPPSLGVHHSSAVGSAPSSGWSPTCWPPLRCVPRAPDPYTLLPRKHLTPPQTSHLQQV